MDHTQSLLDDDALQLRECEERLRAIMRNTFDLVAFLDTSGRYLCCNDTYTEVLGYTTRDLSGRSFLKLVHPDDRDRMKQIFQELFVDNKQTESVQITLLHHDGHHVQLDHHFRLIGAVNGTRQILINARDITECKRLSAVIDFVTSAECRLPAKGNR